MLSRRQSGTIDNMNLQSLRMDAQRIMEKREGRPDRNWRDVLRVEKQDLGEAKWATSSRTFEFAKVGRVQCV